MASFPDFPCLPVTALDDSALETTTHEIIKDKPTIIDFWTTRCTNCPEALDHLNTSTATDSSYQRIAICCDKLDGAREILDATEPRRWSNIQHYFMDFESKEHAKSVLNFKRVPFYVVLNSQGEIVQMGNAIDWDALKTPKQRMKDESSGGDKENATENVENENREFVLDDLDF